MQNVRDWIDILGLHGGSSSFYSEPAEEPFPQKSQGLSGRTLPDAGGRRTSFGVPSATGTQGVCHISSAIRRKTQGKCFLHFKFQVYFS